MGSNQPSRRGSNDSISKDEKERPKRPPLPHLPTSATMTPETQLNNVALDDSSNSLLLDIGLLTAMLVMLIWPWVFFGAVWAADGVRMNNHAAQVVIANPHTTSYFVTLISNLLSMIIGLPFSLAIVRYAKEWVANEGLVEVFHVLTISALKSRSWPWGATPKSLKPLLEKRRWMPVVLVILCIGCFTTVTSGITSLLTPAPFIRNATLAGQEFDFSASDPDCVALLNANPLSNNCGWESYNGLNYTNCLGENQMVDVLESGRGSILSLLPDNTQSLTFSQLGGDDGLHFLGSIHGILPIGPNGVPAFDTLQSSPLSDPALRAAMLSYNYTLDHQGLKTDIECTYDTSSPITVSSLAGNPPVAVTYGSTCPEQAQVLTGVQTLNAVNSQNLLTFWACQTPPNATDVLEYFVYLRGIGFYESAIGNIACKISPVETGIFSATYQSLPRVFSLEEPTPSAPLAFPGLIELALVGLGDIISEGQNFQANDVAESVITFGVKSFNQPAYNQTDKYLELYRAMIQGILDYEATYVRLIYSTLSDPPASCLRTVSGLLSYQLVGWSVQPAHIGFLMPMTVINLSSLALLIGAMIMARKGVKYDSTDPRVLMNDATVRNAVAGKPDEWKDIVAFGPEGKKNEAEVAEANENNRDSIAKSV